MIVKLLTEHHLEFLSLKGGCRGSSESTLVKMSKCWKSHVLAQFTLKILNKLGKKIKCEAVPSISSLFHNRFNQSQILDSKYHITV